MEPTKCHLWQKNELVAEDLDFEHVKTYFDNSHSWRYLQKCKQCGQLYVHDSVEEIDWLMGDDKIYTTIIPVSVKELEKDDFDTMIPLELLKSSPAILWNPDNSVKWMRNKPLSTDKTENKHKTKNIYFVCHGQTEMNGLQMSQSEDEPLTGTGLQQAKMIAQRVTSLPVDIIHASPMKRAAQTAGIIQEATGMEIIWSDLLKEPRRPSDLLGHKNEEEFVKRINAECNLHQDDINWHYSDEENFLEYKARAKKALEYLESLPQENILVVSHGNFIKMLVMTIALGDPLQPANIYSFANKFRLRNTGLTYCKKNSTGWSVESFNDHQHLG